MASLAGVLQAILLGITNPNLYTVDVSISHLAMMVVGGSSGDIAASLYGSSMDCVATWSSMCRSCRGWISAR